MAEPDYLEGDCDELIKPKKLINPVKNSRNHQDLHRELLMNQKRSGDPENVLEMLPPSLRPLKDLMQNTNFIKTAATQQLLSMCVT